MNFFFVSEETKVTEVCGLMIDAASLLAHNGVALLGWLGLNIGGML